jgi:hypothetical protein
VRLEPPDDHNAGRPFDLTIHGPGTNQGAIIMAYKTKHGKVVRQRRMRVGDMINTETYTITDADGVAIADADGARMFFWFEVPNGTSREEAFATQQHYGPFKTDEEVKESQRVELLGEQCEVKDGGMWDPAWSKVQ